MVPVYKRGDRSAVTKYRPVSLTSVFCKQLKQVIAGYLLQVWDKNDWLYEGRCEFRAGQSCDSQVITVCHDIADPLDEVGGLNAIIIDFSMAFDLQPHDRLPMKLAVSGEDSMVVFWVGELLVVRIQRVGEGG